MSFCDRGVGRLTRGVTIAMLHDNINIFHLMVYARRVEEARSMRKSRDPKRARSFVGGSSMNRLEIQDKTHIKKQGSNQVPTDFPRASGDRLSNPKLRREKVQIHQGEANL